FEAGPGAAAHEPDVRRRWVTVDDEVLVGRVFVLAHPCPDQRGALQAREPRRARVPRRLQPLRRGYPLARGGVERWPAGVVGDLEPAPLVAGNPVYEPSPVIRPHGQRLLGEPHVARGRAETEDLLAGSAEPITNDVRQHLPQPRSAG